MQNDISVNDYLLSVDNWIAGVGSQYFEPLTNGCMLSEEVGEVNRLLCRQYREQRYKAGEEPANFHRALADELSDVMFVLACIANEQGINLAEALVRNLQKKSARDANRYRQRESKE
ncbi:MazG nucleotide pyrophosphohydrolase domain-containing protein [uncultured Microbulbifer sp.]|uniref:MazG nucleotide pyrophosphohydrolase domain-containing protein n=1 Tax=uncultured Microbulbifer sp. TaxID=348147 RepID=UPI0026352AEE|nr:MazG nucleotide pyrophosphohydrolase domain-containing protein [uncultured Microbulbifer sp.]